MTQFDLSEQLEYYDYTEADRQALAEHGPCPIHRLTFRSVLPRRAEARAL